MTAALNSRNSACRTGKSLLSMASTVARPRPGHENTYSTVMAPETTNPKLRKVRVSVGSRAFGTACRHITWRSRSPLARAVSR